MPFFLCGSPRFELVSQLTPLATEAIFDKINMSAFVGTLSISRCETAA